MVLYFSAILPYGETPPQYPACIEVSLHNLELGRATYDSMPDGYMLDIWVLISDLLDCMLQTVRESLLVGFEIGPASIELMFAMSVLLCLVKGQTACVFCRTYKRLPIVIDDQVCD